MVTSSSPVISISAEPPRSPSLLTSSTFDELWSILGFCGLGLGLGLGVFRLRKVILAEVGKGGGRISGGDWSGDERGGKWHLAKSVVEVRGRLSSFDWQ